MICTTTLKAIKLTYSGEQLKAMLQAWEAFPTLKKDCAIEREAKRLAREARYNKIIRHLTK